MSLDLPSDDILIGEHYYILASGVAAELPKLVLKHDEAFLVADHRGDFPNLPGSEFGLYAYGTRYLSQCEVRVHRQRPLVLNAGVSEDGLHAAIDLTNPDVPLSASVVLPGRALRVRRDLTLYASQLYQVLTVESFVLGLHDLLVTFAFAADFVDLFEVRGHPRERRGETLEPLHDGANVRLRYRGLDGSTRVTTLTFEPPPEIIDGASAQYRLSVAPGERREIRVVASATTDDLPAPRVLSLTEAEARRRAPVERLNADAAGLRASHDLFDHWMARSRRDLHLLVTETSDGFLPYAGIPWYVAPFGRDAIITSLQVLPFEPAIAAGTLRFLGRYIGAVDDAFTDQQPGKILHEYRLGEMAACHEVPFIPYYGSADATPLYVMLFAEYVRWTNDLALAHELWPAMEQAVRWIIAAGDAQGRGYVAYERRSPKGLLNQGWKDSHDAIMHASGKMADAPIALAEVQGYQYAALLGAAEIAAMLGRSARMPDLLERARRLQERFEADFWMPDEAFYALALDGDAQPCRVISSNPLHLMWTGLIGHERARIITERVMQDDMFTGWGLRTLSSREQLYNPMSYHNGSVWPHDTAIAATGMRRFNLEAPFLTLTSSIFEAVLQFEQLRMPELFCGFPRTAGYAPTRYPVACSPQAWSAGVVFQLVAAMLGLTPAAGATHLTLNRPRLPGWLDWLEVRNLRIGTARLTLRVSKGQQGAAVELLSREGDCELIVRR
jgi:glycogen debranching enzyme